MAFDWRVAAWVAVGGALGSVARYAVGVMVPRGPTQLAGMGDFPLGTFLVNVAGSFLIGVVLFGAAAGQWLSPAVRSFVAIGILGGFTTMSSFAYDTVALVEQGRTNLALANVALTLVVCLGATWTGRAVAMAVWSPQ